MHVVNALLDPRDAERTRRELTAALHYLELAQRHAQEWTDYPYQRKEKQ